MNLQPYLKYREDFAVCNTFILCFILFFLLFLSHIMMNIRTTNKHNSSNNETVTDTIIAKFTLEVSPSVCKNCIKNNN